MCVCVREREITNVTHISFCMNEFHVFVIFYSYNIVKYEVDKVQQIFHTS